MSLKNINPAPRFSGNLAASRVFADRPMVIVDIGARRGFEPHWSVYGDQARLIGFEADAEECHRLNREAAGSGRRYFPVALHRDRGKRPFYITAQPSSSGFYPANMKFASRLPDEVNLTIVRTIELDTVDLDSFAAENSIGAIDFIKLDTEGCELDILRGAGESLRTTLGLSIEVEFLPLHEGQPLFSDVDAFLRPLGFMLYDLAGYRHSRKALPVPTASPAPGPVARGQVVWGQALYLRDFLAEVEAGAGERWDDIRVLKLASLMELFGLPDCAIEVLQAAQQQGRLEGRGVPQMIDRLVPPVGNRTVSYAGYLENVVKVRERGYADSLGRTKKWVPTLMRPVLKSLLIRLRNFIDAILR
ncbi:MAG TPA: FkbM family methyltransferase [Dehalococcoidales bacterium]|nr:MAG: hypothetical protein A2Z05_07325 [Chloroflexi bacterium RBG_16_60_22]HJX13200.1 FkbM family methyltransferase [Dehalococcoidales bacterium]